MTNLTRPDQAANPSGTVAQIPTSFLWSNSPEPHASRKVAILKAHPEISSLMGPCPWTKYQVLFVVLLQVCLAAYAAPSLSWPALALLAWSVGGTANSNLQLAMHEISHNLAFSGTTLLGMAANRVLSIVANLPLGIPAAIAFRKYHLDHHRYQGHDGLDVDLPTDWEGRFFRTPLRKLAWVIMQPLFYALRPLVVNPKPLVEWEAANIAVQVAFDLALWWAFGPKSVAFLILSTLLGMGLHPTAYHFISEHFTLSRGGFETFSYYGPLNALQYHVGYHNEHHDFPNIPGSRLHRVKEMAPEFYNDLPHHTSWWRVFADFIFRDDVTPYSRVKRGGRGGTDSAKLE